MRTKHLLISLVVAGIATAGCGNNTSNSENRGSILTDTSMMDTMHTDSASMVDTSMTSSGMTGSGTMDTSTAAPGIPRQP